jgi:hypothetical protein
MDTLWRTKYHSKHRQVVGSPSCWSTANPTATQQEKNGCLVPTDNVEIIGVTKYFHRKMKSFAAQKKKHWLD